MQTQRKLVLLLAAALAFACADDGAGPRTLPGPDPGSPGLVGRGGEIPGVDPEPRLIEVIATEYGYNPRQLRAEPGEQIIVALRNLSTRAQNIEFAVEGATQTVARDVMPGETGQLRLTIPAEPGGYEFYSPDGEMRERGMAGNLYVMRPPAVRLELIATGLTSPIGLVVPPQDAAGRRFVLEQTGTVRILTQADELLARPFLDLRARIVALDPAYDERGLLGLAFHPDFAHNGRFFVHYSAPLRDVAAGAYDHTSYVSEFAASPHDPNHVDVDTERVILAVDQPQANHNGGTLAFGPRDGMLYVALGDGGGAADRGTGHSAEIGNGQDRSQWLGSILRIDIDRSTSAAAFRAPDDNPFVHLFGAREVFAYGLRNPAGMSFDLGGVNTLMVPDAGEALWEEVNRVERGGNYGWNIREGTHCFDREQPERSLPHCMNVGPSGEPLLPPVIEFPNATQEGGLGAAVIGGYVYRGEAIPELYGHYVFGTFGRSALEPNALLLSSSDTNDELTDLWPIERIALEGDGAYYVEHFLKGFGRDERGELYVLVSDEPGPSGESGRVLRLEAPID